MIKSWRPSTAPTHYANRQYQTETDRERERETFQRNEKWFAIVEDQNPLWRPGDVPLCVD